VKIWLITLFLVAPALAWSEPESKAEQKDEIEGWEAAAPGDAPEGERGKTGRRVGIR
jgi:hypothetical protein